MHQPGEPSVEEILDSIKKVIARDNREGAMIERRRRAFAASPDDQSPAEPAVLELGEGAIVAGEDEADGEANAVSSFDTPDMGKGEGEGEAALIADRTREAMRQNLEALAMISKPGKQPQIVRSGETSLEGLTRELLRPMLAQWLDANLPAMVEELVKAEITRIAGKRS